MIEFIAIWIFIGLICSTFLDMFMAIANSGRVKHWPTAVILWPLAFVAWLFLLVMLTCGYRYMNGYWYKAK